ncbi:MAG TPA: TPM domain-containing protein [Terracidiphilus sp.]|nr:TPM domain-containing protein [Terracidiphilus sp.]
MNAIRSARGLTIRLMLAALVFLCAPVVPVPAEQVKDLPKPTDYVSDFAHVLSPDAVAKIDSLCAQLDHTKANAQIAVVTVKTLEGEDSAQWANELEDQWKMGRKGSDRGVLVLLAVDDRKRRIEVGYGLEGILNDAKLGDIGRAMVPYLRARDYDNAVLLAVGQVGQTIADDAGVTLTGQQVQAAPHMHQSRSISPLLMFVLILIFFGGFGLLRLLLFLGLLGGGFRGGPWLGGGPFIGGGGGGGGNDSGGGGFGGFGGGSFGGGGAGGDW